MINIRVFRGNDTHCALNERQDPTVITPLTLFLSFSFFPAMWPAEGYVPAAPVWLSHTPTYPRVSGSPSPCAAGGSAGGWPSSTGPDSRRQSSWASDRLAANAPGDPESSCRREETEARAPGHESHLKDAVKKNKNKNKKLFKKNTICAHLQSQMAWETDWCKCNKA